MRLLIVGNMDGHIGLAAMIAKKRGVKVTHVEDADGAMNALRTASGCDLIMAEVRTDINKLYQSLTSERIHVPIVACGIQSDTQAAVRAIKSGAKEYIPLPPDEELIAAVLEAITEESTSVIHASEIMKRAIDLATQIAKSDASVLITGESGTGKEVMARHIHRSSKRSSQPFISVNCAAIPETLLESELFGYEKGAFTGAVARRIGKFEEANNGTLLLDEISEMEPRLQAKLLRVLQEQEIDRIGGNKPVKVDIRILATSNRNLELEVSEGRFREDLYFRLNVIRLHLPPLRERTEDIPLLANHFITKYSKANGLPPRKLSKDALHTLEIYSWPGNARELENTMHRAVLTATADIIGTESIALRSNSAKPQAASTSAPATTTAAKEAPDSPKRSELVGRTVDSVERELILDTLNYCLGNRTHAANILGISIRTLRNKLKEYSTLGYEVSEAQQKAKNSAAG